MKQYSETLPGEWQNVRAYAETRTTRSLVARPATTEECRAWLETARANGLTVCPRGAGYTHGDMILNHGQIILDLTRMDKILSFDSRRGRVTAQPGVSMADLFRLILPENWTISACPGGSGVTLGGALANNVHGKDAWTKGHFGSQVLGLKLLSAGGEILSLDPDQPDGHFKAVVGGMGLLGLVVELTLKLSPIPSAYVLSRTVPSRDYRETLDLLERSKQEDDFSVAWVDAFAAGPSLGRGVVISARWAEDRRRPAPARLARSLETPNRIMGVVPPKPLWTLTRPAWRPAVVRKANALGYSLFRAAHRLSGGRERKLLFTDYNFLLHKIPELKQIYRPQGFLQFQPLIPGRHGPGAFKKLLELGRRFNGQALLCGVKTHRPDDFIISYSGDGYSVGMDLQVRGRNPADIKALAEAIFAFTADIAGKIYLAKDEMLPREKFQIMYPRYREFAAIKKRLDPEGLFSSDMYNRLLA